jgi:Zn-dependent oligopeptidase
MYSAIFKSDPLDPARGDRYRNSILRPGGSREELDSLKVKEENSSVDIEA